MQGSISFSPYLQVLILLTSKKEKKNQNQNSKSYFEGYFGKQKDRIEDFKLPNSFLVNFLIHKIKDQ